MTRLAIRPAFHFSSELDRLFSERPSRKYNWSPSVDTHEAKEAFVVTMELPGVSSEDVSIRLDDDTLTISGEKKEVFDKSESKLSFRTVFRQLCPIFQATEGGRC